jgi:hypothetical protein
LIRSVHHSVAVAASTLLLIGAGHLLYDLTLCSQHRRWVRVSERHDPVIRDTGHAFARSGDAIYACTTPHALGPITWHQDLDCYCAPETMSAEAVGRLLGGLCSVDQPAPSRTANTGACRQAHCFLHIDP